MYTLQADVNMHGKAVEHLKPRPVLHNKALRNG